MKAILYKSISIQDFFFFFKSQVQSHWQVQQLLFDVINPAV